MPYERETKITPKESLTNQNIEKKPGVPRKKKFVKPTIKRHEALPEVTTGFVGSFVP